MSFAGLLLFGSLAAIANLAGGTLPSYRGPGRISDRWLKYLIALGAGFMLAAVFIELVPETFSIWTENSHRDGASNVIVFPMALLLAGYLLIQLFEHTLAPHFHFGEETHPASVHKRSAAYSAVGGLIIHTFFDGVSIAAAFLVNSKVGLLIFIAIFLHKVPEGFTVASIVLVSGRSASKARLASFLLGAATLAGVITVAILRTRVSTAVAYALPFSAGVTLYVAASDLIPEVNHAEEKNPVVAFVVFVGVALFYLLHYFIES